MASSTRTFVALTDPRRPADPAGPAPGADRPRDPQRPVGRARHVPRHARLPRRRARRRPQRRLPGRRRGRRRTFDPFTLNLQSLGAFPDPARPRVVWVGVTGPGLDALASLQAGGRRGRRRGRLPARGRPLPPPPHPRPDQGEEGRGASTSPRSSPTTGPGRPGNFAVAEVVTFASTLTPEGPAYMALARAPLRGEKHGRTLDSARESVID